MANGEKTTKRRGQEADLVPAHVGVQPGGACPARNLVALGKAAEQCGDQSADHAKVSAGTGEEEGDELTARVNYAPAIQSHAKGTTIMISFFYQFFPPLLTPEGEREVCRRLPRTGLDEFGRLQTYSVPCDDFLSVRRDAKRGCYLVDFGFADHIQSLGPGYCYRVRQRSEAERKITERFNEREFVQHKSMLAKEMAEKVEEAANAEKKRNADRAKAEASAQAYAGAVGYGEEFHARQARELGPGSFDYERELGTETHPNVFSEEETLSEFRRMIARNRAAAIAKEKGTTP